MKMNDASGDMLLARFKQMGAHELTNISSRLYYIGFNITPKVTVTYVYNINQKDQYFLQRIAPYPLPKGIFTTHEEIIDFIAEDLSKFRNAALSKNFEHFLDFNHTLNCIEHDVEHLFLNYNVPKESIISFNTLLLALNKEIQRTKNKSSHILVKSTPYP